MMLAAALRIAAEGHRIFPCDESKRPLVAWRTPHAPPLWTHDYIRQITDWWTQWPDALIGHPTGMRSSSSGPWCEVVIDVDIKRGAYGLQTLAELEQDYGPLPETCTSRTRSGGQHRWFWTLSEIRNSAGKIGKREAVGLDVRGEGGFVIVPPSAGYEWIGDSWMVPDGDVQLAELPDAWVNALIRRAQKQEDDAARLAWIAESERSKEHTSDVVQRLVREIATAPKGSRNDTLSRHAFTLGCIVAEKRMTAADAERQLEYAVKSWPAEERDERKDADTAARQLRAGMEA
jgi:hypothetical protein